ncbi:MAG: hydantoinase B/oxoprolinase family protein [Actinomycetota bacterium]|nr:hydantoinase B/oxoprolinase family protein [Actinomycetota bacterium]
MTVHDHDTRGTTEPTEPIDPIRLSLTQHRLDHISRHMGWVMERTARSPIFSQSHDFSCFITDAAGTLVSNADGIPIHTGGGGFAVRALLAAFAAPAHGDDEGGADADDAEGNADPAGPDIADGDVFLLNDPYAAGGNHLPDWVIARPVFATDDSGTPRLVAFCCNRAHQSDIGGGAAGTYNPEATEIYHEGLRLPPVRIVERGRRRDDLWALLLLNVRTPHKLDGDLRAMIGSTRIGAERIVALVDEVGLDGTVALFAAICDHAERRFRQAISELTDGRYEADESTDNDCFDEVATTVRVAVTIDGDAMTVDFSGTDPQMRGFKNSSVANTYSAVYLAVAAFLEPDLPRNEGAFRAVRIVAPEGTVVNARPPAPMTMNTVYVAHEIVHAVWKALAQAAPERALAGWGKNIHGITAGHPTGRRGGRSDEPWVLYHWASSAGGGAIAGRDGFDQIGHLIALGGLTLPNLESAEQEYPMRFRRQELRRDAGGPGQWRGGTGIHYEVDVAADATWSFRGEGLGPPSGYGVRGGGAGANGTMSLTPLAEVDHDAPLGEDGPASVPAPRFGLAHHPPTRVVATSPGGGGWGDPLERDPAAVARDVADGVVSTEAAARDYGVVLAADGTGVDEPATTAHRAHLRSQR